jgi:hypothetical protein
MFGSGSEASTVGTDVSWSVTAVSGSASEVS